MIIAVRTWLVLVGLGTILAAGLGSWLALRTPGPPELAEWQKPCRDSVTVTSDPRGCEHPDHSMELYSAGGGTNGWPSMTMVKCVCRRPGRAADAAAENR